MPLPLKLYCLFAPMLATAQMSGEVAFDDDGVASLGVNTFDGFVSGHPLTLVAFVAPWCGYCKRFKPEFKAAAEELKDEANIAFARVDCVAHEKLYDKYKVEGFPTVKLFRHGVFADTYDFAREKDAVISYAKKWLAKPGLERGFTTVDGIEDLNSVLEENFSEEGRTSTPVVLTMFDKVGKHTDMEKRLTAGALSVGGAHIQFVVSDSKEIQERYFKDENRTHPETGEHLVSELPQSVLLTPWLNAHTIIPNQIVYNPVMMNHFLQDFGWPLVVEHHYKNASMLFKKRPGFNNHVILFTDADKDDELRNHQVRALANVARGYRGKAVFVVCDPTSNPFSEGSAKQLKVTEALPALRIVGSSARSTRKVRKFRFAPYGPFGEQSAAEELKNPEILTKTIADWVHKFFESELDDMETMKRKSEL